MVSPHATAALTPSFCTAQHNLSTPDDRDDLTRSESPDNGAAAALCCFSINGIPDPGLLPRLLQLVAKRGLMPSALHAVQAMGEDGEPALVVDLHLDGLPVMTGELMAESMRQIPGVTGVSFAASRR